MSGVAGLYNVASTRPEIDTWASIHASHHRDVNRVIYQLSGINLLEYILEPFDPNNADDWLRSHQAMHQEIDIVLGIEAYNLIAVNMKDHDEFASWVFLNADEHFKMANILGIG